MPAYIGASYAWIHDVSRGPPEIHWVSTGSARGVVDRGFPRTDTLWVVGSLFASLSVEVTGRLESPQRVTDRRRRVFVQHAAMGFFMRRSRALLGFGGVLTVLAVGTVSPRSNAAGKDHDPAPPPAAAARSTSLLPLLAKREVPVFGSFIKPGSSPDVLPSEAACPPDMTEVEGEYCPFVEQRCLRWLDPATKLQCAEFDKAAMAPMAGKCLMKTEHKKFCIDRYEWPNKVGVLPRYMASWVQAKATCEGTGKRLERRLATMRARASAPAEEHTVFAVMRDLAARSRALAVDARRYERELIEIIGSLDRTLLDEVGVGPISAAKLLVCDPARFKHEAAFARANGTAPLPASSGKTVRHRLNRGGDRKDNNAIHTIALSRSLHDPETRAYLDRRISEGKTKREAMRALKRHLSRTLFKRLSEVPLTS